MANNNNNSLFDDNEDIILDNNTILLILCYDEGNNTENNLNAMKFTKKNIIEITKKIKLGWYIKIIFDENNENIKKIYIYRVLKNKEGKLCVKIIKKVCNYENMVGTTVQCSTVDMKLNSIKRNYKVFDINRFIKISYDILSKIEFDYNYYKKFNYSYNLNNKNTK